MAAPAVTASGTAISTNGASTPVSVNLAGGVAGDIAVVFIANDGAATMTANGAGWTKVADVTGSSSSSFPTATSVGTLGASLTAVNPTGSLWRTSTEVGASHTTEVIGGNTYKVYTAYDFSTATTYIYVDDPYVKFKTCKFAASGAINNTSALVQSSSACLAVIWEDCDFDGGLANHNRGINFTYGSQTVTRCKMVNTGDAAVELEDSQAIFDMLVQDCYIAEVKGWPPSAHTDGIQCGGGRSVTVHHNTIWIEPFGGIDGDNSYVSDGCVAMFAEIGNIGNVLIDNNQMAGGGACVRITSSTTAFTGTVSIHDNVFDRTHFASIAAKAAVFFTLTSNFAGVNDTTWAANTFENGAVLTYAAAIL